jgi:phosphoserine phosphatase
MFDLDVAKSNELKHEAGLLTGEVIGDIVDAQKKADLLLSLAESNSISKAQTLAVGDGANDLVMMSAAGFGVAYHAKPKVQVEAQGNIQFTGLQSILYLLR